MEVWKVLGKYKGGEDGMALHNSDKLLKEGITLNSSMNCVLGKSFLEYNQVVASTTKSKWLPEVRLPVLITSPCPVA